MIPDRAQAEAFLVALAGSPDATVTWQLFSDNKAGRRLAAVYHYPIEKVWRELSWQNNAGIGIFIMVNAGDGGNRAAANVIGLRALFVDDDKGVIDLGSSELASLPPSIIVRSKRGLHLYWLLNAGEPLSRFTPAQEALAAHFGTDTAVKDLPRVMRVPGFFHMKDPNDPFMVQLVEGAAERRYAIDQVLAAFPVPTGYVAAKRIVSRPASSNKKTSMLRPAKRKSKAEALGVLEQLPRLRIFKWAAEHAEEVSHEAWRGLATNIATAVLGNAEAEVAGESFFQEMSLLDPARYSAAATTAKFKDALKSAGEFGPMRYETLIAAGVPEEVCVGAKLAAAPVAVAKRLFEQRKRLSTHPR